MSKGDTVHAIKNPAPKAAQNCVGRPIIPIHHKHHAYIKLETI